MLVLRRCAPAIDSKSNAACRTRFLWGRHALGHTSGFDFDVRQWQCAAKRRDSDEQKTFGTCTSACCISLHRASTVPTLVSQTRSQTHDAVALELLP